MTVSRPPRPVIAGAVWLAALAVSLAGYQLTNDYFDRISRGRQIVRYGELPFRDFFDPGYFLTDLSSAALQLLFGDRLLGDALLAVTLIASGTVLVFLLAERLSGSRFVALTAAMIAVLSMPRPYDFDKFFFYPLGLLLCWRYVERRTPANLVGLAGGIVVAALFRYDTGLFIVCAAVVTLVIAHPREGRVLARRGGLLVGAIGLFSLPFLLMVQLTAGLLNATDQVLRYAVREGARTRVTDLARITMPQFVVDPSPQNDEVVLAPWFPSTGSPYRAAYAGRHGLSNDVQGGPAPLWTRMRRTLSLLRARVSRNDVTRDSASAFLFYVLFTLPVGAPVMLMFKRRACGVDRCESARVWSLVVMCLVLDLCILRNPIYARIGGMIGPAAILGAWMAVEMWWSRPVGVSRALVVALFGLTVGSVSLTADWNDALPTADRLASKVRTLSASPSEVTGGLAAYVRECTRTTDRVFAFGFLPELYFYSQRAFAGAMIVTFGHHWSEEKYQREAVAALQEQAVPIVFIDVKEYAASGDAYSILFRFLERRYVAVGETMFESGGAIYRVLTHRGKVPTGTHSETSMPCFA